MYTISSTDNVYTISSTDNVVYTISSTDNAVYTISSTAIVYTISITDNVYTISAILESEIHWLPHDFGSKITRLAVPYFGFPGDYQISGPCPFPESIISFTGANETGKFGFFTRNDTGSLRTQVIVAQLDGCQSLRENFLVAPCVGQKSVLRLAKTNIFSSKIWNLSSHKCEVAVPNKTTPSQVSAGGNVTNDSN